MDISRKTLDAISQKVAGKFKGQFKTYDNKNTKVAPATATPIHTPAPVVVEVVVPTAETPMVPAAVEATVIDVVNVPELVPTPIVDESATAVQLINNTQQ